ncbi:MAG: DNA alkylation repair protein, partial [Calditrichota bacterium]
VFGLLGYTENPKVELLNLKLDKSNVQLGGGITASFQLKSSSEIPQKFVLDYAIHYMKANGKTSPKVFKFTQASLDPNEIADLNKTHSLKDVTTRKKYPGKHHFEVLINGQPLGRADFELLT